MLLKVVIAPSGFTNSIDGDLAADAIEQGVLRALKVAGIVKVPTLNHNQSFTKALVSMTGGILHQRLVMGPTWQLVPAQFGFLGGEQHKTAVMDTRLPVPTSLKPFDQRKPLRTTSYGVGELIKAALDEGAERILLACGGSGVFDCGMGMTQALGGRFLDGAGQELGRGGEELNLLEQIDLSQLDPRIRNMRIDIACDWREVLCGGAGIARTFSPRKGGSMEMVEEMSLALERFAALLERDFGAYVRQIPGGGAAGGVAACAYALFGAVLHPNTEIVMDYLRLNALLKDADVIITTTGVWRAGIQHDTLSELVLRRAHQMAIPVISLDTVRGSRADAQETQEAARVNDSSQVAARRLTADGHWSDELSKAAEKTMHPMMIGYRAAQKALREDIHFILADKQPKTLTHFNRKR
ncbi:MAG: glycerate kinase [Chloroflexota bacterium]|nr:glycerate kinase [Chloroflexota bacterium]